MKEPAGATVRTFQVPKADRPPEGCEDAFAIHVPQPCGERMPRLSRFRLALADGATCTSGSRNWARLLAIAAVESMAPWSRFSYLLPQLQTLRSRWMQEARGSLPSPAPWFVEAALERGAFSTLLRLHVEGSTWRAEAWGDTCLFHYRGDALIRAFPYTEPAEFDQDPFLLASVAGRDRDLAACLRMAQGRMQRGDRLLLATDAAAQWLLRTGDWNGLRHSLGADRFGNAFQAWVEAERAALRLKNDDTSLILLENP